MVGCNPTSAHSATGHVPKAVCGAPQRVAPSASCRLCFHSSCEPSLPCPWQHPLPHRPCPRPCRLHADHAALLARVLHRHFHGLVCGTRWSRAHRLEPEPCPRSRLPHSANLQTYQVGSGVQPVPRTGSTSCARPDHVAPCWAPERGSEHAEVVALPAERQSRKGHGSCILLFDIMRAGASQQRTVSSRVLPSCRPAARCTPAFSSPETLVMAGLYFARM